MPQTEISPELKGMLDMLPIDAIRRQILATSIKIELVKARYDGYEEAHKLHMAALDRVESAHA